MQKEVPNRAGADWQGFRPAPLPWTHWQAGVVQALRVELRDIDPAIGPADIDWQAWRGLFEDGYPPYPAVLRGLERDL